MKTNSKGFTLIELLVVIAIIGILSTIAMTSLNGARKKAADASFKSSVASLQATGVLCCDANSTIVAVAAGSTAALCTDTTVAGNYPGSLGAVTISKNCTQGSFQIDVAPPTSFAGTLTVGHCDETHCWYA